jgi:hypothetical protein
MKPRYLPLAVAMLFGSALCSVQAAPPDVKPSPSTPVQVMNDNSSPVPVTLQGTGTITGNVTVANTSANAVPVSGTVTVSGTPNVNITGGSLHVGTKLIVKKELDNVDSNTHTLGPFDISPYSRIRFSVVANGNGSVNVDIETDASVFDTFSVDAGNTQTAVYEVAGTSATIFVTGNSSITQVFVTLFGN